MSKLVGVIDNKQALWNSITIQQKKKRKKNQEHDTHWPKVK